MLKHSQQIGSTSCGAVAFKIMISDKVDLTEKQAKKECKTGRGRAGTYCHDVLFALRARGMEANLVTLNVDFEEYSRWLYLNSMGRKLYLACHFICKAYGGKGGRNRQRHHAIIAHDGYIYDPGEAKPVPIESYFDIYNKSLMIKNMILVDNQ